MAHRLDTPRPRRPFVPAALLLTLSSASLVHGCSGPILQPVVPPASLPGGSVQGFLFADLGTPASRGLALPGLKVSLQQATSGDVVATAETDRDGMFLLSGFVQGDYQVCWEGPGWLSACGPDLVLVREAPLGLPRLRVSPDLRPAADGSATTVVWGRVELADRSIPGRTDPFFEVEDVPSVRIQSLDRPVLLDSTGTFVAAGVPASSSGATASFDKDHVTVARPPAEAAAAAISPVPLVLTSSDRPPIIDGVEAFLNDKPVTRVRPGSTVRVRARVRDADGDDIKLLWKPGSGSGACAPSAWTAGAGAGGEWTLPAVPGTHTLYVVAKDGKGGHATGRLDVSVSADGDASGPAAPPTACGPIQLCEGCPPWRGHPSQSPFFTRMTAGKKEWAEAYYKKVDPGDKRTTLGEFWSVNGFDEGGGGGTRAAYLNHGDLGVGRDMHCKTTGAEPKGLACYVTNYGCFDQSPANADLAAQADRSRAVATVAMEYAPELPAGERVSFFVFKGGVAEAERVISADLDGHGEKFVPHLCATCHGGHLGSNRERVLDAKFRELDLSALRYTGGREHGALTEPELETFRALNDMVKSTLPPESFLRKNIEGWYANGGNRPDLGWVPEGWKSAGDGPTALYQTVIAPNCRTCHVALDRYPFDAFNRFTPYRDPVEQRTCVDGSRLMPHSATTYGNFWRSEAPGTLARFEADGWGPVGACPKDDF